MKSISLRECGSLSFDKLRTNGIIRSPFVLSLSKDAPPSPPFVPSPPTQDPFILSLSKGTDHGALNGNPRQPDRLEIRNAPAAG